MKRGWFYDIGNVNKEKKRQNNTILRDPQDILLYEDLIFPYFSAQFYTERK